VLLKDVERMADLRERPRPADPVHLAWQGPTPRGPYGKELIQNIVAPAQIGVAHGSVFVEDYDMNVERPARPGGRRLAQTTPTAQGGPRHLGREALLNGAPVKRLDPRRLVGRRAYGRVTRLRHRRRPDPYGHEVRTSATRGV